MSIDGKAAAARRWVETVGPEHVYERMDYHASCGCSECDACLLPEDQYLFHPLNPWR